MKTAVGVLRLLVVVLAVVLLLMDPTEAGRRRGSGPKTLSGFLERCLCGSTNGTTECNTCFNEVNAGNTATYADLGSCLDDVAAVAELTSNTQCISGGRRGRGKTLNTFYERCLCGSTSGTTECNACFDQVDDGTSTIYGDLGSCLDGVADVEALTGNTTCIGSTRG